jgi:hypothetical protein
MRSPNDAFHLAIPCADLEAAREFYVDKLGCRLARSYDDRITLDFFGDQVVCHLAPDKIDRQPEIYPRHFGVTFSNKAEFERILALAQDQGLTFFSDPFVRFEGEHEQHTAFILRDPSNNLIEFKHYDDSRMIY